LHFFKNKNLDESDKSNEDNPYTREHDKEKLLNSSNKKSTKKELLSNIHLTSSDSITQPSTSGFINSSKKSTKATNEDRKACENQSSDLIILKNENSTNSDKIIVENNTAILEKTVSSTPTSDISNKANDALNQKASPVVIDHRLSLSSMSSLNSGLKSKSSNFSIIINELDKEYKKTKILNQELHINTNTNLAIENEGKKDKLNLLYSSSNTSTISANSLSVKDNEINITANNYNNTIICRYKQFERERNSFNNSNNSNNTNNNNDKTEKNQKTSNNNNQSFDFGSRINKLRFIDDSASSTALTSPAESLSHFQFGQRQQQQQHLFLKSNNYKNSGSHVEPNSTDTSRTVSLSASTNPSSCCSTPMGSINKRQGLANNIAKINPNIKLSAKKVEKCISDENNRSSISSTSSFSNKLQNMQLQHENLNMCYSKGIFVIFLGRLKVRGWDFV
jgi:hypothetical protein